VNNSWGFVGDLEINKPLGDINVYVTIILKYVLKKYIYIYIYIYRERERERERERGRERFDCS